jgi:O-antigen ligase/Tfp pilus assembly protein PilF
MLNKKNEKTAEFALFVALGAALLLPLVVVKGIGHPFLTPRELFFRMAMAAALPLAAYVYRSRLDFWHFSKIGWSAIFLLFAALLSTIFSVDPSTSFWGAPERLNGFLTIFLLALFGLFVSIISRDNRRRRVLLYVWGGVWLVISSVALYERIITGPFAQFHGMHGRVIATIGNPIFFASGIIIAASVLLPALLQLKKSTGRNILVAAAAALVFIVVIFTETRGAYIGLAAGAIVGFAVWSFLAKNKLAIAAFIGAVLLIAVGTTWLFINRNSGAVKSSVFLSRAASVFNQANPSVVQRRQLWTIAVKAVAARPLTGWGLENFDTALDRNFDPNFTKYGVANSYSDRAHNQYLDVAAAAGFLGLAGYLGFLTVLTFGIFKAGKIGLLKTSSAAAALGGLAAYAVSNLTAFDTVVSYLGLALGAALLASLLAKPAEETPSKKVPTGLLVGTAVICSVLLMVFGVAPLFRGAVLIHVSTTAKSPADLFLAASNISGFWNPYRAGEEHRIANDIFKVAGNTKEWSAGNIELVKLAENLLRDATRRRPNYFPSRFTLGNILLLQAMHGLRPMSDAVAVFDEARALAPRRQVVDFQIGNIYLVERDYKKAVTVFERALALAPEVPESHWHLGRGLAAGGETEKAALEFQKSIVGSFYGDRPAPEYAAAITALVKVQDFENVRLLYRAWARADSENADALAGLAAINAELGRKAESLAAVKRALELDPTLQNELPAFLAKYGYTIDDLNRADPAALNLDNND